MILGPTEQRVAELREAALTRDQELIERARAQADACEPIPPHDPATCLDCRTIPELELRALAGDR